MTERNDNFHRSPGQEQDSLCAPASLLPAVLAQLGLAGSRPIPPTSLEELRTDLTSSAWTVRVGAVDKLAALRDPESFALLLPALRDEDASVRATAVRVFGIRSDLADPAMIAHLKAALQDADWHVRETAQICITLLPEAQQACSDRRKEFTMIENIPEQVDEHAPLDSLVSEASLPSQRRSWPYQILRAQPRWRLVASVLAAVLVLSLVVTWSGWIHLSFSSHGSRMAAFSEANALQLGAPLYTFQSDQSPSTFQGQTSGNQFRFISWSPDGRFFSSLLLNAQKNRLQVRVVDTLTGKETFYPVLDSSWVSAGPVNYTFQLVGNDLVAFRSLEKGSAMMEIWGITARHQLAEQIVPSFLQQGGPDLMPFIEPTQDGQKFALQLPDDSLEIWDTASGQRLATGQGLSLNANFQGGGLFWYHNDQDLLSYDMKGHVQAWDAATGRLLFRRNEPAKTYFALAVSPDSKYLALQTGRRSAFSSSQLHVESVEILESLTGKLLHTNTQVATWEGSVHLEWLVWSPDSRRLSSLYDINNAKPIVRSWDAFIDRAPLSIAMPMDEGSSATQDLSYITLGSPDHRSLEIIQASSGRKIATVATPDYARSYRHSMLITTKPYIMLFQQKAMYIWSIATGKLLYTYHGSLPYFDDESQWVEFSLAPDSRHLVITGFRASRPGMASQPDMATTAVWSLP